MTFYSHSASGVILGFAYCETLAGVHKKKKDISLLQFNLVEHLCLNLQIPKIFVSVMITFLTHRQV